MCCGLLVPVTAPEVRAAISYAVPGSTYSENFDSLPADAVASANIQVNGYPNGWQDDASVVAGDHVGVPGWYLYHPNPGPNFNPIAEGGTNGHQRIRFGPGANTGGFWAFRNSNNPGEMALGCIGSLTVADNGAPMYRALRLTNDTGMTLDSFTVTFDGEQWRDGQGTTGETQTFGYSLTATVTDWHSTAAFIEVPELSFTSPVVAGTGSAGTAVDGNTAGLTRDITATITGIAWAPGTDLWLRWNDPQLGGGLADDGLAIDNVTFTAAVSAPLPDAGLAFGRSGGGALQLAWQGAGDSISYQVQHSTDLAAWTSVAEPAPESAGAMTYEIPAALQTGGRHYYRLRRTRQP